MHNIHYKRDYFLMRPNEIFVFLEFLLTLHLEMKLYGRVIYVFTNRQLQCINCCKYCFFKKG